MATQVHPVDVSDANFHEVVLHADTPVIVDFWAAWCNPCRMMAPTFEELAGQYSGRVVFAKMNVDESPQTPGQLGIQSIPTMVVFKNGEEANRLIGAQNARERITAAVEAVL